MENKSVIFAKLAGILKYIKSIMAPFGPHKLIPQYFKQEEVKNIFHKYSKLAKSLKEIYPDLYSDIPDRTLPKLSEGDTFKRSFLETLERDIDYIFEVNSQYSASESKVNEVARRIFLSHGSSQDWMKVQNYIERDLKIQTLELAQEPNKGRTVLQKLNEESDKCSYCVVVMTGDDKVLDTETRARENVMHEIGFFQGKYGLEKVCLLYEEGTNIPSNIHGLVYIAFPKDVIESTFGSLSRELDVYFK